MSLPILFILEHLLINTNQRPQHSTHNIHNKQLKFAMSTTDSFSSQHRNQPAMEPPKDEVYFISRRDRRTEGWQKVVAWHRGSNAFHVGTRCKAQKEERRAVPEGIPYVELSTFRLEAVKFHNPDPAYQEVWQLCTPSLFVSPNRNPLETDLLPLVLIQKLLTESSPTKRSGLPIGSIWFASDVSDEGNYYPAIVVSEPASDAGGKKRKRDLIEMRWLGNREARKHWKIHNSLTSFTVERGFRVYIKDLIPFKAGGPMMLYLQTGAPPNFISRPLKI